MGWFFGFKLHLICNEKGELLNFMITPGDVDELKHIRVLDDIRWLAHLYPLGGQLHHFFLIGLSVRSSRRSNNELSYLSLQFTK